MNRCLSRPLLCLCPLAALSLLVACPGEPEPEILIVAGSSYEGIDISVFPGVVGLPNLDDDNQDGTMDWDEDGEGDLSDENDRAVFFVSTPRRELKSGESIRLSIGGDAGDFRAVDG